MCDLQEAKQRAYANGELNPYWLGIFVGQAGAFMRSRVITYEQYNLLIDHEYATT